MLAATIVLTSVATVASASRFMLIAPARPSPLESAVFSVIVDPATARLEPLRRRIAPPLSAPVFSARVELSISTVNP